MKVGAVQANLSESEKKAIRDLELLMDLYAKYHESSSEMER